MSIKNVYSIKEIDKKLANDIQIKNHYLQTKASCVKAFGLFEKEEIIGVILYGNPTAPTTMDLCGVSNREQIIEITRLWIKNNTLKNVESYLIANTIKLIHNKIVVAFADPDAGHIGTVYQAANFLYTGKSERNGRVIAIKNSTVHNKTLWKRYKTALEIRKAFGEDNVYYKKYITKHRYVYIKDKKLLKSLIYAVAKYPKLNHIKNNDTTS